MLSIVILFFGGCQDFHNKTWKCSCVFFSNLYVFQHPKGSLCKISARRGLASEVWQAVEAREFLDASEAFCYSQMGPRNKQVQCKHQGFGDVLYWVYREVFSYCFFQNTSHLNSTRPDGILHPAAVWRDSECASRSRAPLSTPSWRRPTTWGPAWHGTVCTWFDRIGDL